MSEKQNSFQLKSNLIKDINFFFQTPTLGEEKRAEIVRKLQEIRDDLVQEISSKE